MSQACHDSHGHFTTLPDVNEECHEEEFDTPGDPDQDQDQDCASNSF